MYNEEYGIKVGYNAKTQMLYYAGDYQTNNKVSQTARNKIIEMLSSDYSKKKSIKKFGQLYFGYKGMQTKGGYSVERGAADRVGGGRGSAYVNLDDYDDDLNMKDYDYSGLTSKGYSTRTFNMARAWEHEYFGHVIQRRSDPNNGEFKPGKVEFLPNLFRSEMGLPLRSNYGIITTKGSLYYLALMLNR